ncbi:hypothetical protein GW765_01510 [Candidatus Parcubacteria bacterium]|nr:hypothetical protein [Candidatus Parcubacteria bacterium]
MTIKVSGKGERSSGDFGIISESRLSSSENPSHSEPNEEDDFPDQSGYVDSDDEGERNSGKKTDQIDTDNPY